ncbi:MAG TPA: GTPase Era [Gemmatimonadaceae bacterium]
MTRSGIVTVVGRPNAGKSTLLNRLVGQKLSITSAKPQTTRDRVVGIVSTESAQLVLFDTPGLLNPQYALQSAMRSAALAALRDADVVLYVADAAEGVPAPLVEAAGLAHAPRAPVIVALNKADLLREVEREVLRAACPDARFISALSGEGVDALLAEVTERLPESPFLYAPDDVSTQSLRFFASELVRETALEQLSDEVPYSVACEIEEFREDRTPLYIRAVIYVERESQKRILIGAKGARIRELGRASRIKLEELVGAPVYLDLWVKVLPNWRRKPTIMQRFGYRISEEHST